VKEFLSQKGVKYVEKDVSVDRAAAMEMVAKTRQRGVPVITIDDEVVVGFNRPQLEQILASKGPSMSTSMGNGEKISLGVSVAESTGGQTGPVSGALVGKVNEGSIGQRLGLRQGDVISSINGTFTCSPSEIETVMKGLKKGQRISVNYFRGGKMEAAETTI
jgi:S1-C subfamily serine protease